MVILFLCCVLVWMFLKFSLNIRLGCIFCIGLNFFIVVCCIMWFMCLIFLFVRFE